MSPTGFGSVPCEKIEILLDGERVEHHGEFYDLPDCYCYPKPVQQPLPVYVASFSMTSIAMAAARGYIDRERLRAGFEHLIVDDGILDQLGPAVNAGKAVFLYGAPGNGKSVMGDGIGRALGGSIYVPAAIDVDGDIITDAAFQGSGCAISKASASLMTDVLKGKSVAERAQALISLAHPDFREGLERQAYEHRLIPRGVTF